MQQLADKVAFITGGVSGIGLGIARALLSAGMRVIVTYRGTRHLAAAQELLAPHAGHFHALQLDVSDRAAVSAVADEAERVFGKIHVLCNNAGVGIRGSVRDATYNDWDWALAVNVLGVVHGIRSFLPKITRHGEGGHIVSTASMSGLAVPQVSGLYAATKYAVVGMMEALRGDLAAQQIGVSVYCPGLVRTNLIETEDARPARYAEPGRIPDQASRRHFTDNIIAHGMDPLEAGNCVLQGILRNDLYILSHPEFEPAVRERFTAILQSFPADRKVPAERLHAESLTLTNPTYGRAHAPGSAASATSA